MSSKIFFNIQRNYVVADVMHHASDLIKIHKLDREDFS